MNERETGIVILNYKNFNDTINCISSLYEFIPKTAIQVIVVDNNSQNKSLEKINERFQKDYLTLFVNDKADDISLSDADLLLVQNHANNGYGAGNNIGLKLGQSQGFKYLMVLNNDTIFIQNSLEILIRSISAHDKALCVGPLLLKGDRKSIDYNCARRSPTFVDFFRHSYIGRWLKTSSWRNRYYYLRKQPNLDHSIKVDIISGSCMLFDAKKFADIDFFDPDTFLYSEEIILYQKAKLLGFYMVLEPNAKVIHLGAQSTKSQITSLFMLNCEYDSLKIYLKRYRKMNWAKTNLILLNKKLFIQAYSLKMKLKS